MDINDIKQETDLAAERKVNQLPVTYDSLMSYLNARKNAVIDGYEDAHILAIQLKNFEEAISVIKEQIKETILSELSQPIEMNGFRIEETQSGRYDYSDSLEWQTLEQKKKQLEKDMQAAYKSNHAYINEETGEIIQAAKFKPYSPSYKITKLKK